MAAADKLTKLTRRHSQHVTAGEPKAMAQLKLKIMCLCVMKNKTKKDTKEHRGKAIKHISTNRHVQPFSVMY